LRIKNIVFIVFLVYGAGVYAHDFEENLNQNFRRMAKNGIIVYQTGRILAWGGLGLRVASYFGITSKLSINSNFIDESTANSMGFLATTVGIPIMGVGSSKVSEATLLLYPDNYKDTGSGWPMYWTGWAVQGLGFVLLLNSLESLFVDGGSGIGFSLVVFAAGNIMHYVAWYKFSKRKSRATLFIKSVNMVPTLTYDKYAKARFGGKLQFSF